MKTLKDLTPEQLSQVKSRLFAGYAFQIHKLYHTQMEWQYCDIRRLILDYDKIDTVFHGNDMPEISFWQLPLKDISSISKEHALQVASIFDLSEEQIKDTDLPEWIEALFSEPAGYYIDGYTGNQLLAAIDFLRQNSYFLPFYCPELGRMVSQQEAIEAGLIKIREAEK